MYEGHKNASGVYESQKMSLQDFIYEGLENAACFYEGPKKNASWLHEGLERAHQDFMKFRKTASWFDEGLKNTHHACMKVWKKRIRILWMSKNASGLHEGQKGRTQGLIGRRGGIY